MNNNSKNKRWKQNIGITLVSLIVTIIIILILAGIGITLTINIVNGVKRTAFLSEIAKAEEATALRIAELEMTPVEEGKSKEEIYKEKATNEELKNVSEQLIYEMQYAREDKPAAKLPTAEYYSTEIEQGEGKNIFYVDAETVSGKEKAFLYDEKIGSVYKIKPLVINGVPVFGSGLAGLIVGNTGLLNKVKDSIETSKNTVPVTTGKYELKNGEYVCTPDLSGFNAKETYYVTWDANGKEIMGNTIDKGAPENWYNYSEKKWANVVTMANNKIAYWVWIPRYAYKLDTTTQKADIRFVDTQNNYIDAQNTANNATYTDRVPVYEGSGKQTNYVVGEGFNVTTEKDTQTALAGYWVSKYELADFIINELAEMKVTSSKANEITIKEVITSGISVDTNNFDIYVDGVKKYTGSLPYTLGGLDVEKKYEIGITVLKTNGVHTQILKREVMSGEDDYDSRNPVLQPDLTGFNTETTYYVTYNEATGEEIIGNKIKEQAPNNWYDYPNKKWANIVTINNNKKAYFVWIPRYAYKLDNTTQKADIRFVDIQNRYVAKNNNKCVYTYNDKTPLIIDSKQINYVVPSTLTVDGKELAGIWISKYELSE